MIYRWDGVCRELADTVIPTECSRSAACSGYKHHYQECVERVTAQHENPEHKGPKEDCVEECERSSTPILKHLCYHADIITSLPPTALRHRLRCSEALQVTQVEPSKVETIHELGLRDTALTGQLLLEAAILPESLRATHLRLYSHHYMVSCSASTTFVSTHSVLYHNAARKRIDKITCSTKLVPLSSFLATPLPAYSTLSP